MDIKTLLAQAGSRSDEKTGALSTPIYQTATFRHPALGESTGYDYSRSSNPTRAALEETLAALDGGVAGFAFASGMAAIAAVFQLFGPNERVIVTEDLYGGTFRLLEKVFTARGLEVTYVDTSSFEEVEKVWTPDVKGVFIEIPTNPMLKVAALPRIAKLAKESGALTVVDNTFLTPVLLQPLEHGADIVVYSASKYLSGHNDVVAGAAVAGSDELAERIYFYQNTIGAVLGPQDSWLVLRGLKTLALRVERQQENALAVAKFLESHPAVSRVYYPGLPDHPGHERLRELSTGFGGMVSFELKDTALVPHILSTIKIFHFAESLGGVESLLTFPAEQTHADMPTELRSRLGITDALLRLSVGIESSDDLIDDLSKALNG